MLGWLGCKRATAKDILSELKIEMTNIIESILLCPKKKNFEARKIIASMIVEDGAIDRENAVIFPDLGFDDYSVFVKIFKKNKSYDKIASEFKEEIKETLHREKEEIYHNRKTMGSQFGEERLKILEERILEIDNILKKAHGE